MNRLRSVTAVTCGILFVVGIVGGTISIYTSRTLFDEEMFATRVSESLAEPHIARVVSNQVTDQIVAMRRELTPFRPVLLSVVERVVTSPPFRAMVKLAARKIHPALITHGESLALGVQDLGVVLQNALALYPQVADKVPAQALIILGSTETQPLGRNLLRLLHIGRRTQQRGIVWPSIGILFGALGLILTRRKDLYLLRVGLGLAIVALLIAAIARFGGYAVAGLTRSPVLSDLITGGWLVFLAPLAWRMLILAGLGIVLVAAVTTLLEKVETGTLARKLWAFAWRRPVRAEWIMARGLALATIAVLTMLHPVAAAAFVTIVLAAIVFFVGIQDIFVTAAQAARKGHVGKAAEKKRQASIVPAVVGIGLVALLVAGGVVWLARGPEPKAALGPAAILACNGYPELRDRRLTRSCFRRHTTRWPPPTSPIGTCRIRRRAFASNSKTGSADC